LLLAGSGGNHRQARDVLLGPVLTTMAADPVADGIWRTVMASKSGMLGKVALNGVEFAWLGLGSALKEASRGAPPAELEHLLPDLLFGGSRDPKSPRHTPHACPGRQLALGALLGAIEALLRAGKLAAPLNPLVLELSRP
jgi:hypothetical protein